MFHNHNLKGEKIKDFTKSLFTLQQIKLLFMKDAHEESDMVRGLFRNEVNVFVVDM